MSNIFNNNSFGLFVPNSNFNFKVEWIKNIEDHLFINTKNEELIIFKKNGDDLLKKFILLTNGQVREKILDVFLINLIPNLINIGKKVIITITEKFILNYWSLKDGLCISNVNLSKHLQDKNTLLFLSIISNRFIVFFFREYLIIFDSYSHLIIKQQKLEFSLSKIYQIKENKYFLLTDKNITYLFQFKEKDIDLFSKKPSSDNSNLINNKINTNIKNFQNNINKKSKYRKNSSDLNDITVNSINPTGNIDNRKNSYVLEDEVNFQYENFIISLQKSFFLMDSYFESDFIADNHNILNNQNHNYSFNNDFNFLHFVTFENGNYIFHSQKSNLCVSYYNQFEEINVSSTVPSDSKFSILFMNKFIVNDNFPDKNIKKGEILLFVIFKDLSCVVYKFNCMINQIEKVHKFYLMIEDEFFNMKYLLVNNLLIGYIEDYLFIFDFNKINFIKEEKYVDNTIELNNLFNKKNDPLNFTNYFRDNFKEKYNYYMDSVLKKSVYSQNFSLKTLILDENKSISPENTINMSRKSSISSEKDNKKKNFNKIFKITSSTILSDPENQSIYYIFGNDTGKIAMLDIFFNENLDLNPVFRLNYHISKIYFMMIIDQKYLISASEDGVISITDVSKNTIERSLEKFKTECFRESVTKAKKDSKSKISILILDNFGNLSQNSDKDNSKFNRIINHSKTFVTNLGNDSINFNSEGINEEGLSKESKDFYFNNSSKNFMNLNKYSFNGFFSRRKSFKTNDEKIHVTIDKILDFTDEDSLLKKNATQSTESVKFINLLPILTMKNYYKLKKIIPVNFVDLDNLNQDKQKYFYGIVLEDNSALIINTECMKIIYNFNINFGKKEIKGIYLKHTQKILMFYMGDGTLKVVNYINKMGDREITDINQIYNLLRVEDKIKNLISDPNKFILENFNLVFDYEEFQSYYDSHNKTTKVNTKYYDSGKLPAGVHGYNDKTIQKEKIKNLENSLEFILGKLETEEDKSFFIQKYMFNLFTTKKFELNISMNKFEASSLNKIDGYILDKVYDIVNSNLTSEYSSNKNKNILSNFKYLNVSNLEKFKKIEIYNLINNPNKFTKLNDKNNTKIQGVDTMLLLIGNQSLECLDFYLDEFIQFLDRKVEKNKNAQQIISQKINYINYISLFRIWNLSVDQDSNILNFLKIFQPIFDFDLILKGENNSLTLQLAEESDIDGYLNEHFHFFKEYILSNEDKKRVFKDDKYFDKKFLMTHQKGYLVNYKNFKISSNISHILNLAFYSCLISILGFQESTLITKLIISEKNLMRSLSQKKFIKFTNFFIIYKYFYEEFDDVSIANKDIILFDYLLDKGNKHIIIKLENILTYLKLKIKYLFKDENENIGNFYKLNKEKNIDCKKLDLLNQYDLFLINIIITFDSIYPDFFLKEDILEVNQLLILLIFKFLKTDELKSKYSKIIVEILSKSVGNLELIYKENMFNYAKFLIEMYTSIKVPIDLDGCFKKYDLDICTIIKSDSKYNFLKIMLAKQIKYFAKLKINTLIYLIVEEFKKKTNDYNYFTHLLEILWLLFREKNPKYVQYLPSIINLLVTNISPQNKDMKNVCLDYSKKILASLISYYPMVSIDTQSQKLAVGANDGKIYIYDLSTGSFWKNLNAHQSEITALIFDYTGNIIISYSSTELNVKFWKIGLTNFLSNFFTAKNGYYQIKNLDPLSSAYDEKQKIDTVKFQGMPKGDNRILLIREDHSNVFMKL